MKLVCIVEGKGEVRAIPNLCTRILHHHLQAFDWFVGDPPIWQPRARLVNEALKSPSRTCHEDGLRKAVLLAQKSQRADAVLVLCDADDDCPAVWGPDARRVITGLTRGDAVMAIREYETWLLLNHTDTQLARVGVPQPERKRGAKEALAKLVPGYLPTTHQLTETQKIDLVQVRKRSDSFDKLVRVLAAISGAQLPTR